MTGRPDASFPSRILCVATVPFLASPQVANLFVVAVVPHHALLALWFYPYGSTIGNGLGCRQSRRLGWGEVSGLKVLRDLTPCV